MFVMSNLRVSSQAACVSAAGTLLIHPYSGVCESSISNSCLYIQHSPTGLPNGSTVSSVRPKLNLYM